MKELINIILYYQTPMVVYLASIGSLMSYRLGALRMMPPEPAKHVRVNRRRKSHGGGWYDDDGVCRWMG